MLWSDLYPWAISALGGFLGAALLLPTKLGEAVFNFRLGKALEGFKAAQGQELERLKEQLTHLSDRGRRSNELEFTSIELVWRAFVKAWLSTNTCIGSMTEIPLFAALSDEEVKSFASGSGMSEREQNALMKSSDREKEYLSLLSWRRVNEAGNDIYQARFMLREQRIFMPEAITKEFTDVIERMSGAQVEKRLSLQHPHIRSYEFGRASTEWLGECQQTFERLANLVNERLFRKERQ